MQRITHLLQEGKYNCTIVAGQDLTKHVDTFGTPKTAESKPVKQEVRHTVIHCLVK